ncbi:non-ribosomal peptide synthase/polyketide synthase [Actinomadura nitritigenes]|uniref:non-ribosomal peptide synthase/polyketide synthase n=1 Tax=Actinomadura nitritigenes TaxID=134602 RepID=UPI0036A6EAD2
MARARAALGDGVRILTAYGVTEATIDSTYSPLEGLAEMDGPVPVGGPLPGARVYVLDRYMGPVAVGVTGEVFIGGVGVARGYGGRPALTAERFVADPFAGDGSRLYRTGDRGRWRPGGQLEFLGRADEQVKVRGFRIEPGEVEAVLLSHPAVAAAAVAVAGDEAGARLAAWLVPADPGVGIPAAGELREYVSGRLPEFMVPSVFTEVAALPLSPNGKVDRSALPAPDVSRPDVGVFTAPATATQELLAGIWALVLEVERVGADDNFFELGGHSLLATQVISRVREVLGVEVPVAALFDHPTVAELADVVDGADRVNVPAVVPVPRDERLALSFAQQRLWFLDQMEPGSVEYNVPTPVGLGGEVDVAALGAVLSALVERHEVLRTRLVAGHDGVPYQVIDPPSPFPLPVVDVSSAADPRRAVEALVVADAAEPFDLATGPVIRGCLARVSIDRHLLVLSVHHAAFDEWSALILRRELRALHTALGAGEPDPLPPLPVQYADYALWQRTWLSGTVLETQLAYWRDQLAALPTLDLPTDRPRPAIRTTTGAAVRFTVPAGTVEQLRQLARDHGATMFMTTMAAFAVLLGRYTSQHDIPIGTPIANRNRAETENLIGYFVNTLVIRTDLTDDPTFAELLQQLRTTALAAYAHQDLPFEQLVDELVTQRDRSRTPLFQTLFNYDTTRGAEGNAGTEGGRQPAADGPAVSLPLRCDLELNLAEEHGGGLSGSLLYSTALFDADRIQRLAGYLTAVLDAVAANPHARTSSMQLLPADERQRLLESWNDTEMRTPSVPSVADLILEQAAESPDAVAVTVGDTYLTYAGLVLRAGRLAATLRELGAGPESVVALCLERGTDMVVAGLATWLAGAAYLPLDPGYPPARLAFMLADSGARVFVGNRGATDRRPADGHLPAGVLALWLDDTRTSPDLEQPADAAPRSPGQLAYMIYTSGSTGVPKGVSVSQQNLMNLLLTMARRPGLVADDVLLAVTTFGFDIAGLELWLPLVTGARVVVAEPGTAVSAEALAAEIDRRGVTVMQATPATWRLLAENGWAGSAGLRALCGGEALPAGLAGWLLPRVAELWNMYGPTETTIWSACRQITDQAAVTLGGPVGNTRMYVVDPFLNPVPVGAAGELLIAGAGVARGYHARPGLTAERFVADPFAADGSRLYRTGDLARRRVDGRLEYLGRIDQQVKLRGFRVELGEVEALLSGHPGVRAAVAAVTGEGARTRLAAWLVPADASAGIPAAGELRERLREHLPEYMIPAFYTEIAAVPLTPAGKTDRAALPAPGTGRSAQAGEFRAPATPGEELLAGVWAEILGVGQVGADDDFFDLGGHSLLAVQVISRIRDVFGAEVPVAALFDHPTVAGLANVIAGPGTGIPAPHVEPADRTERLPLSFAQQRLWLVDQMDPGSVEYNMPMPLAMGGVAVHALGAALSALVERHEVLRTRLVAGEDGVPFQVIDPPSRIRLPVVDVSGAADPRQAAEALVVADEAEPFDLAAGPLIRACLVRVSKGRNVLVLSVHHIVFDEWSAGIFRRELAALYEAFRRGEADPLPALPVQYADFAVWQRQWLTGQVLEGQLAYWREQLADAPVLDLPTDRPRPPVRSSAGAAMRHEIPPEVAEGLRAVAREGGATMFMTVLSAFMVLLGRYAGQDDVVVGTPVANRDRAETEGLIGFFVNTLVMRADLSGDPSFGGLLRQVRQVALAAYANQDLPFEQLVDELVTERDQSRTPLFQVAFSYIAQDPADGGGVSHWAGNTGDSGAVTGGLPVRTDLVVTVGEGHDGGLVAGIQYGTTLFDAPTVARLAGHLAVLLEGVAAGGGERRLSELPVVSAAEREELLSWGIGVEADGSGGGADVAALVAAQVEVRADSVAVVMGDACVTYGSLMERAGRLAGYLQGLDVGAGSVVGLCVPRGVEMVVGVLGVWLAGAAYVPLDPGYPADRLGYMLADSGASVVVGTAESAAVLGTVSSGLERVVLDDPATAAAIAGSPVTRDAAAGEGLAYVMYTSGSTGRPKGVLVGHAGVANLVAGQGPVFGITPGVVVAGFASFSFDAAVSEVWVTLGRGGRLVIVDESERVDTARLGRLLAAAGVGVVTLPPSVARLVDPAQFARLATLVLAGERVDEQVVARWAEQCVVVNAYGPTEASVCATAGPVDLSASVVPIGAPLPGVRVHVLDERLNPAPMGVAGELFIGGLGLAWGYAGRASLTAERFVADPLTGDGSRLYRSGDRARWRPGGVLEFLGRVDEQVKLRGFRIEPGEVEAVLTAHPHIGAAAVAVTTDTTGNAEQGPQLAAWLVPADPDTGIPATAELREFVGGRLPEFMIPAYFTEITHLPLTRNGKLDRAALPAPDTGRPEGATGYNPPRGELEELLAGIWEQVLGISPISATDSLFELGGNSLLLVQIISRVREVFGTDIKVATLFDQPTIRRLGAVIEETTTGMAVPPVVPVSRDQQLPLSFGQQRLWFADQLEPGSAEYNVPMPLRLPAAVDAAALQAALSAVTRRHEVLRTRLLAGQDGVPYQVIDPPAPFPLPVVDVSGAAHPRRALEKLIATDAATPFDLATGPVIRAFLALLGAGRRLLVLCVHHAAFDEWSGRVLQSELTALQTAFSAGEPDPLPPLPVQYADFAVWQRQWLTGEVLESQLAYWREQLAGLPVLDVPADRARPPVRSTSGAVVEFTVPAEVTEGLRAVAHDGDATMFMTLLAAFMVLLARYTGQDDIVIGTPVANRERGETQELIGYFVNNLVMRGDLSGDPTFAELLGRVRQMALEAYAHQDLPFEQLVDELVTERDRSRTPLFQVLFNYDTAVDAPGDQRNEQRRVSALTNADPMPAAVIARADLRLILAERDAGLTGAVEYSTDLFDAATAARMAAHLGALLESIATDAGQWVSDLAMDTPSEQDEPSEADEEAGSGVVAMVLGQAAVRADAVAVVVGDVSVTYGWLVGRAGRLAGYLQGLGVGPGSVVGLCVPRDVEMVAAVLGVWLAGAAYVPLDPGYPPDRLGFMLADSGAGVVVGVGSAVGDVPVGRGVRVVELDDPMTAAALASAPAVRDAAAGEGLAYVMYTSGSTGRPKGVLVDHGGVANLVAGQGPVFGITPGAVVAGFASFSFDAAVSEVWVTLGHGGRLVIVGEEARIDVGRLGPLVAAAGVGVVTLPPSVARVVDPAQFAGLATLVLAGERVDEQVVAQWADQCVVVNAYGPTEASVCATAGPVDPAAIAAAGGVVSIGAPLPGVQVHVLDKRLKPVLAGMTGELFIGGAGLAWGYAGRAALTAERFVADPLAGDGSRLYRSGDRARWRPGEVLEFAGRVDEQVKLRGFRIEPGEVEAVLAAHPQISAAAVAVIGGNAGTAEAGEQDPQLVAWLVPADPDSGVPSVAELREFAGRRLPEYMIPAYFSEISEFPLSRNGKLDRAALPAPDAGRLVGRVFVEPRSETERALAGIWAELLKVERVGVEDNFFELGAHSLLATRVVSRVRSMFGVEIAVSALFDAPTLGQLAEVVDAAAGTVVPPIAPVPREEPLPLSFAQQRLWFLDRLEPGSVEYNVPMPLRLPAAVDVGALTAALSALVERHEVLRTRLVAGEDGVPFQAIDPPSPFWLPVVDVSAASDPREAAGLLVGADAVEPFDLAAGPLIRACLVRVAGDEHVLVLSLHHVVSDEWSAGIFRRELAALYEAFRRGEPDPLPALPVQYADFAVWQRRWLTGEVLEGQLAYWRERLAGIPVLDLPTDRPRPPVRSTVGAAEAFAFPAEMAEGLRAVAREGGATMFMTVLSAFMVLLGRYAGQDDVVVGTPVANRDRAETEGLIGFFVNTLVMRADLSGDPTFAELLEQVRGTALDAYAHQDLPFEQLVDELVTERDRSRTPLFQVFFGYDAADTAPRVVSRGGAQGRNEPTSIGLDGALPVKFDLSVTLEDRPDGGLAGAVEYSTALFDAGSVARLVGHLGVLLEGIAGGGGERRLSELRVVSEGERAELLGWGAGGEAAVESGVVGSVLGHARVRADAVAVVVGDVSVTYGRLVSTAERLAGYLRGLGVAPGSVVGLCVPRRAEMVVGVLAAWLAGAAYVPLDPGYPADRLEFMLADSGADVVVGMTESAAVLGTVPPAVKRVVLDDPATAAAIAASPAVRDGAVAAAGGGLAYVIYTSGSTGRPKGVLVGHGGVANLVAGVGPVLGAGPGVRVLQFASFSFDAAVLDVAAVLAGGGTLVVAQAAQRAEPARLTALVRAAGVRAMSVTPSLLAVVDPGAMPGLVTVLTGAELLTEPLSRAWLRHVRLVNTYGPTEATVMTTTVALDPGACGVPPIGAPVPNARVRVLDDRLGLVPAGVSGEVFIGGAGLALGYHGRPALTAERFIADPFADDGSRLYRTGDRARWRADGLLEFTGRADEQVKVRGFRIEPGEIEAVLTAHPAITTAAVTTYGDHTERRLAAWLVPADPEAGIPDTAQLREHLARHLPDYMIPALFTELAALPLTPNGKIDRAALTVTVAARPEPSATYVAPATTAQELMAGVWAQVLGVDRVGGHDDFFELGGHSLLATRLISRIREVFDAEVPVASLFDHPTVAGLVALIEDTATGVAAPPVVPVPRDGRLPLSFAQQRLWFLGQLDPESVEYNVPTAIRLRGPLDLRALDAALGAITRRHEALRTRLLAGPDGVPYQEIDPPSPFSLPVADISGAADTAGATFALVMADAKAPFDLAAGPVIRGCLVRVAKDDHVLLVSVHHVAFDEWSERVLRRELEVLYRAFRAGEPDPLPPLPVQYADFAVWQRKWLTGDVLEAQLGYWRDQLAGAPTMELPVDRPRPAVRSSAGAAEQFTVPAEVSARLAEVARQATATTFMVWLSAVMVLLGRYCGQDDVVTGTPVANRERGETEGLIGFFVNTLVMRADLGGDPSFGEVLGRVRAMALDAYAHQDLPFEQLVDELAGDRDRARTALFQVMVTYVTRTTDSGRARPSRGRGGGGKDGAPAERAVKFDLTLTMSEGDGVLFGEILYSTVLFDAATIKRMTGYLTVLLESIAADDGRRVSELPLLSAGERDELLTAWNDTATPAPAEAGVHEMVARQCAARPDAVAVVSGDATLTYAALAARAERLAGHLRGLGAGPESVVGLCLDRGPELVVAVLAVWAAGGAYLPLDPAYPAERLAFMLSDSGARVLVSDRGAAAGLAAEGLPEGVAAVWLDDPGTSAELSAGPTRPLRDRPIPGQLAYLIYTSGSTGRPKGVMVEHRSLVNYVSWFGRRFEMGPGDRMLVSSSPSFDAFGIELHPGLAAGGCLVVVPPSGGRADAELLAGVAARGGATVLAVVPTVLKLIAEQPPLARARSVRAVVCGGEQLTREVTALVAERLGVPVHNVYGPTEATIDVSSFTVGPDAQPDARVPIGRPLDNIRLYVLAPDGGPVPAGVTGELYIGGVGVARGYLGRPALTAERFVADPFTADGGRLYRTGDRARWRSDGVLEFLGRADDQVKVRGFRIEPEEIEAALKDHPSLGDAVVAVAEDASGGQRLAAYLVPAAADAGTSTVPTAGELREFLAGRLPEFMVPTVFTELASLPLTPNGKLDRRALPAPDLSRDTASEFVAPATRTEELLAGIWAQVLGLDRVGAADNFFELGGHSLLAIQVISRAREVLGVGVPLAELFDHPTVAGLAAAIGAMTAGPSAPPVLPVARDRRLPLSFAQQRLWFLDQMEPGSAEYVVALPVRLGEDLDVAALGAALTALVARHEVLRTRLVAGQDGVPFQVIDPPSPFPLPVADVSGARDPRREAEALLAADSRAPFDLAVGPLVRACLVRAAGGRHMLALSVHHVLFDDWSGRILRRELSALYEAQRRGRPDPLPPLPVQYADFAVWQRDRLSGEVLESQLAYWRAQMSGAPVLELPADRPRLPVRSSAGAFLRFDVPPETAAGLREVAGQGGATMFMTLLAAFMVLLGRYTGQDDIVVGTPVANRDRAESEGLIGFFVNTLVMRASLAGDPAFTEVLRRVRRVALDAYAHQDLPFERLVDELVTVRDRSRTPLFQVMFNHVAGDPHDTAGRETDVRAGAVPVKFDLTLVVGDAGGGLTGEIQYSTTLFSAALISRVVDHLVMLLGELADGADLPLSRLRTLTPDERRRLAEWSTGAERPVPAASGVHELVAGQAARHPDTVAAVYGGAALTYGALLERSARLAAYLRGLGVGAETTVGLCLERGLDMVTAMLAVWQAGGAYLPLDPDYPQGRLEYMVADSGARVLVTSGGRFEPGAGDGTGPLVLRLDDPATAEAIRRCPAGGRAAAGHAGQLAYIVYTSGSTGRPKGIAVTHRDIIALATGDYPGIEPGDVVAQTTSTSYDAAVYEIWGALARGATLAGVDRDVLLLPRRLNTQIRQQGMTVVFLITALLHQLAAQAPEGLNKVRNLLFGGEAADPENVRRMLTEGRPGRLLHFYGPAEGTTFATWGPVTGIADGVVPIGRPMANMRGYVVDRCMNPVPVGVPGELLIGGTGLARGYHGRPALTAGRFVADPFRGDGARVYRTGDRVRWLADGTLEFLGRADDQVKVRGFRIEPGEIEAVLAAQPGVRSAVVLPFGEGSNRRLVAYLVPADGDHPLSAGRLREQVRGQLPEFMIPSAFVEVAALPLTANGKLDRSALPAPEADRPDVAEYVAPTGFAEQLLARIWAEVLGTEGVGVHDDFFELGGHSLLVPQVVSRIRAGGYELAIGEFFDHPTIAGAATRLKARERHLRSAVPIRSGTVEPAVFAVHGMTGEVAAYAEVAGHLDEGHQFHGLLGRGLAGRERPIGSVERMASAYLSDVLQLQPDGPYLFTSWSGGCYVAVEMARQAAARGERVAGAILIGPPIMPPPDGVRKRPFTRAERRLLRAIDETIDAPPGTRLPAAVEERILRVRPKDDPVAVAIRAGDKDGLRGARSMQTYRVAFEHYCALLHHRPEYRYDGRVVLLIPREDPPEEKRLVIEQWGTMLGAEPETVEVPGRHGSLVRGEGAAAIGALLSAEITRAHGAG